MALMVSSNEFLPSSWRTSVWLSATFWKVTSDLLAASKDAVTLSVTASAVLVLLLTLLLMLLFVLSVVKLLVFSLVWSSFFTS